MTEKLSDEFTKRFHDVEENYKVIQERMAEAAVKSGRNPKDITLLAATKTVPVEVINHGISIGIDHIGENRVQELTDKYDRYDLNACDLQFIGHLQTNKVKYLIGKVSMIQSVDSVKLAKEISRLSTAAGSVMDILVEVNIGREKNKSGVFPEGLEDLLGEISQMQGIRVRGLMSIPPVDAEMAETMRYFSNMSKYFVDIKTKKLDNVCMDYLSMGMSHDYYEAILSGANLVRVGSALFGARIYSK